jgi:hypothetical protein
MTLFIDNIRLYSRNIRCNNYNDQLWINNLMHKNDLLKLCSNIDMKFIIFTNLEDTPIDNYIENKIPDNVLSINAVNAIYHNNKIKPIPYGLQRKLSPNDNRLYLIESIINTNTVLPSKLLYINHSIQTNIKERSGINELFYNKEWATVASERVRYEIFLSEIMNHKFMICPIGNAIDCHRYWEVLYLRRVPVVKKHPYLEFLFKDLPVLFVKNFDEVTEEMLIENNNLFDQLQDVSLFNLDIDHMFNDRTAQCLIKK